MKSPSSMYKAKVLHVLDGDTITIEDHAGQLQRIRLFGIDAPETGQPFADKSKTHLRRLLGNDVWFEITDTDRYGRIVAILYNRKGGKCVNLDMVESGLAYNFASRFGYLEGAHKAERSARENRRGMWGSKTKLEAPWDYRRRSERKSTWPGILKPLLAIGFMALISIGLLMFVIFMIPHFGD